MKKKIFAMLMAFAMIFSLVACTPNMKSYMAATEKVSEWKGSEFKADINYEITVSNPENEKDTFTMKVPVQATGKSMGQDVAEMAMVVNTKAVKDSMKEMAKKAGDQLPKEELANIPDTINVKMFVNKDKIYINKDVFKLISPEFANIKEEYISMAVGQGTSINPKAMQYLGSQEFRADILNLMEKSLKDFKPSVDYKVEGNTYTIEATSDDILNDISNGAKTLGKNWDTFAEDALAIFEKMGMPFTDEQKKDFKEAKAQFDKAEVEKNIAEIKETIKGSKYSEKSTFEDDKYTSNVTMNFKFAGVVDVKATVNSVGTKNEDVKIVMPTSVKELTEDEYMQLMFPGMEPIVELRVNGDMVEFEDSMPIIKNDRTMVPFRALLEKLGSKVEWDQNTKTVTATKDDQKIELVVGKDVAKVNDKEVKLDSPAFIENDRTYIPARFISENLGYKVKFEKITTFLSVVDVYNIKDEELPAAIEKAEQERMDKMLKEIEEEKAAEEVKDTKEVKENKVSETAKDAAKMIFNFVK